MRELVKDLRRVTFRRAVEVFTIGPDSAGELSPAEMAILEKGLSSRGAARLRAAARRRAIAASYTRREAARHLVVSWTVLPSMVENRSLLAFRARGETWYPRWQFAERGQLLPHLSAVTARLPPGVSIYAVSVVMTIPDPELSVDRQPTTPRQWILEGRDLPTVLGRIEALVTS